MTDRRRTKTDHKSSPCHFVTGELKSRQRVICTEPRAYPLIVQSLMRLVQTPVRVQTHLVSAGPKGGPGGHKPPILYLDLKKRP